MVSVAQETPYIIAVFMDSTPTAKITTRHRHIGYRNNMFDISASVTNTKIYLDLSVIIVLWGKPI